jgi:excisionase family DNA binding protein
MSNTITRKASDDAAEKIVKFKLLTTPEAADFLGMGKRTLQELCAAREIGFIKIGKSVRFHPDDLTAFIEKNRVKAIGWKEGK